MIYIPEKHIDQYLKIFDDDAIQFDILQEECAELIQAISKLKRSSTHPNLGHFEKDLFNNVVEELTHVAISSNIVAKILNINQEDIDKEVKRKAKKFGIE